MTDGSLLKPADAAQLREAVAWAGGREAPLEIVGGGSKRSLGRPFQSDFTLDVSALSGVNFYEPEELVVSAGPATPVAAIEAMLAERGQILAFEPMDYGPLLGGRPGAGTIGGVYACNLSGPRRIKAGAARDHLLGFNAVSGRGERYKSGGRVVKNVTGYDLSKLITGSWGTLSVLTELTFRALPAPEKTRTLLLPGLDDAAASRAMAAAMNSPHEVAGAAHLPAATAARSAVRPIAGAGMAVTALRIEGFGPSVTDRTGRLGEDLAAFAPVEALHSHNSAAFWREVRDAAPLAAPADRVVWRVSTPPAAGHLLVAALPGELAPLVLYDWAGGLVWLSLPPAADAWHSVVRTALAPLGGHATLVRAPADLRAMVPVFQPQPGPLAALSARIKDSFDPRRVLNPGRMVAGL